MPKHVTLDAEAFLKAVILLGFSTYLFILVKSNNIIYYINPRFVKFTEAAAILTFLMFLVQAGRSLRLTSTFHKHPHSGHRKLFFVLLPFVITLLMAFLLPDKVLDASMAQNKGLNPGVRPAAPVQPAQADVSEYIIMPAQTGNDQVTSQGNMAEVQVHPKIIELRQSKHIKVGEDNFTMVTKEVNMYPEKYVGKEITMLGFVFRDKSFPPNQFGLLRYVISCCSADALPDGFLCEYANANQYAEGAWLNIQGILRMGKYGNENIPVIKVTSVSKGQEPQNPYIYPVFY